MCTTYVRSARLLASPLQTYEHNTGTGVPVDKPRTKRTVRDVCTHDPADNISTIGRTERVTPHKHQNIPGQTVLRFMPDDLKTPNATRAHRRIVVTLALTLHNNLLETGANAAG